MRIPEVIAKFNKRVTNPLQRKFAGRIPMHGILEHVGRRSGTAYETPLVVFDADIDGQPGVAIQLTYGADTDWLKNLKAAGDARMQHRGEMFGVTDPQVMTKQQAVPYVTKARRLFAMLPFEQALLLTRTP